ncbi:sialidase family protein [Actinoplanes siamensis]|nr:sialidase family protein [Actinoplanes siamensis]
MTSGPAQAACTTPITIPTGGGTPRADQAAVQLGNTGTVHTPAAGAIAWSPAAIGADVVKRDAGTGTDSFSRQLLMVYSAIRDISQGATPTSAGARVSSDSGATFTAAPDTVPAPQLSQIGQLLDGRLLGAQFVINGGVTRESSGAEERISFPLILRISQDKGKTWSPVTARTSFTDSELPAALPVRKVSALRGVRAAGRPIQMTTGAIVAPVYFTFWNGQKDSKGNELVLTFAATFVAHPSFTAGAVDAGGTWDFTMRTLSANATINFNETAVIERQDGLLLAVVRQDGTVSTLSWRLSSNEGATWTDYKQVSFADQPGCAVSGVSPQLAMLPTGQLVLGSGRPDNWLAISTDTSGTSWTQEQQTYWNAPVNAGTNWWYGSSGYTALVPTGGNRLLQFADNCAAPNGSGVNGCASALTFEKDRNYRIVDRQVAVLPPGLGKIDIAGKLRHGTATLTTDLTGVPPAGAVTPPTPYGSAPSAADATSTGYWSGAEGATDGSNAYWSGALSSNAAGTGSYELKLDRRYHLTKLGLGLLPGAAAGARIATSADGVTWTPATLGYPSGVVAQAETGLIRTPGDRAMRYYTLDATARYLRITTEASTCATVGGPAACSMINELELYSTVNSFENELAVPHGLADVACTRVTSPAGNGDPDHDSATAIRLIDGDNATYCDGSGTLARFSYPGPGVNLPAASARTLQAGIYPVSNTNGLLFDIDGVRGSDHTAAAVYHFGINSGNRWMAWTSAGGWVGLGGAPVPLNTWTTFKVVASTTGATLYTVDAAGQQTLIGTLPQADAGGVDSITGYTFTSGSTEKVGDQAVYDDISFE